MAICGSGLISWPLILKFASAAMTASLSQCSLILPTLNLGVQVRSVCSTV
jgi:hypothetical protein